MIIIDEMAIMIDCKLDTDLHFVDFIFIITANAIISLLTIKKVCFSGISFTIRLEWDFYSSQTG